MQSNAGFFNHVTVEGESYVESFRWCTESLNHYLEHFVSYVLQAHIWGRSTNGQDGMSQFIVFA